MLRWRILLGVLFVSLLAGLGWLDAHAARPGIVFAPLAVLLSLLAAGEMLRFFRASHQQSLLAWPVYLSTSLPVLASCVPLAWQQYPEDCPVGRLGWLGLGLIGGLVLNLLVEMRRFRAAGESIGRLAHASLSVLYVGGLLGMIVQLRLMPGSEALPKGRRGLVALLSMIAIVKVSDIGQYAVGRAIGKHKLARSLSPGKTWEGAAGGLLWALTLVAVACTWAKSTTSLGGMTGAGLLPRACAYAMLLAIAGLLGDLAESLLKRDAGLKDSGTLPGFGGVLDLLDSLLMAAPVAYLCWVGGLLSPL